MTKKNTSRKKPKHLEAMADYLSGMTVKEIAAKHGLKFRTVDSWRARYNWYGEKLKLEEQLKKSLYVKMRDKMEHIASGTFQASQIILTIANRALITMLSTLSLSSYVVV